MMCQCVQFQVPRGYGPWVTCDHPISGEDLLCDCCRTDSVCTSKNGTGERKARRAAEKESTPAGMALPGLQPDGDI